MSDKKTILIHSNFCKAFTGFGKHKKNLLLHLHKTGKYNVIEAANGQPYRSSFTESMPWKCYGTLPRNFSVLSGEAQREASYGGHTIDDIIKKTKPDVYMGIEDIWGFNGFPNRVWWKKINTMIWTTLDSLPILQQAIDFAPKTENYFVWSPFAEKAFKELGYDHVKTMRGTLDTEVFYPLTFEQKGLLRDQHGIDKNDFIIGFVFRNQLRKSVPSLLNAFSRFKKDNPNAKLLLHTHWPEAWDIPRLMEEFKINTNDILTTYFCRACHNYLVRPFVGEQNTCPHCKKEKTLNTTNIGYGVSEGQLNEVYNLMDVYCHPFTSGGQEIPVQEAKLTELITLVTNYSCGIDNASKESGGLPLDWEEYREPGTQFIKASTKASSIVSQLQNVKDMTIKKRAEIGAKARNWVLENFSIEVVGKQIEDLLDAMPKIDYDFSLEIEPLDVAKEFKGKDGENNIDFIIRVHKEILNDIVDKNSGHVKILNKQLQLGEIDRNTLLANFRGHAFKQNENQTKVDLEDVLGDEDPDNRIAIVLPCAATDVFLVNSLLISLQNNNPDCNIYVFTQPEFFELIEDNPACHKCLRYSESLENPQLLEGQGGHKGFFKMAFFPHNTTQKFTSYIHNGQQTNQFKLKK